jgi:hypothetical protein
LEHRVHQTNARVEQVLAVIEHQQKLTPPQRFREGLLQRPAGALADPERRCDHPRYELLVVQRRELDQTDTVSKAIDELSRDLNGQTRLAATARATQCHERLHRHQTPHGFELLFATNEARHLARQVVFWPTPRGATDWSLGLA